MIYGRNAVREALRGRRRVHTVLLAKSEGAKELELKLAEWIAEARSGGALHGAPPSFERLTPEELTARLRTPDHQDIGAVVDPYPYSDADAMLRSHGLLVVLDGVQDPHNLGAIIRTAEGAGAGVLIPRHRSAEVTGTVVKVSAGAAEHAAVAKVRNLADFLLEAKKAGYWIYGAAADAKSVYTLQDYRYPTCFVVGSEGEGLGRRVASLCDVMVSLPLAGKVESLNVSVSAAVLLYEAVRQRAGNPARAGQE
ncbi:MAG: 23S rRNA (guanosine(2251)-2'-O)-methyltransferase RlmB [Actinobacteria bacterium RBG_16_64_13]|nr:MAG: 23S rRNA (guanosine(2251)-2'-O)-methyltransferase RlmB [Actinobacteria bacterium RBG_16_64_13]